MGKRPRNQISQFTLINHKIAKNCLSCHKLILYLLFVGANGRSPLQDFEHQPPTNSLSCKERVFKIESKVKNPFSPRTPHPATLKHLSLPESPCYKSPFQESYKYIEKLNFLGHPHGHDGIYTLASFPSVSLVRPYPL